MRHGHQCLLQACDPELDSGDGRNGTRSWVLATHDGGSIRRIRLSRNELGDLAAILQSITSKKGGKGE